MSLILHAGSRNWYPGFLGVTGNKEGGRQCSFSPLQQGEHPMTMSAPSLQRDVVPVCFGKEWDPRESECAGGPDPNYTDADGGHVRAQCQVFSRCGARTQQMKNATGNLIPAQNLTRPPIITPPPPQGPPRTFHDYMSRTNAEWVEEQRRKAMGTPRPPQAAPTWTPPQALGHSVQVHSPAHRYELNYTMPGYLTVPEERGEGEGLMAVLFREIIRAIFKAVGHTIAHSFDSRRMK